MVILKTVKANCILTVTIEVTVSLFKNFSEDAKRFVSSVQPQLEIKSGQLMLPFPMLEYYKRLFEVETPLT